MKRSIFILTLLFATSVLLAGAVISQTETIQATVSPGTIVIGSDVTWVTVHTDISLGSVATASLTLNGVPVAWTKADAKGNLVAKFNFNEIENIVSPPRATLTLKGLTKNGVSFEGSDTVPVRDGGPKN